MCEFILTITPEISNLDKENVPRMKKTFPLLALLLVILTACPSKKDIIDDSYQVYKPPVANSQKELIADSTYLYAREIYLWNDKLGEYNTFNPRNYIGNSELETAEKIIAAIKAKEPSDIFSYATTIEESEQGQTGNGEDWGFFVKAGYSNATDIKWFLTYVYNNSDAGKKGARRGWYISKINNVNIGYDDAGVDRLNDLFFGQALTAQITFGRIGGADTTFVVNKTVFQANSILYANIFTNTAATKKVGYFVFNQFFNQISRTEIQNVFNYFQTQGITDLIVDLRNNLGGSTSTQDLLANYIAPSSASGKKMYHYEFNKLLRDDKFILMRNRSKFPWVELNQGYFSVANNTVNFAKQGSLNLPRVFFIVTDNSASASELLINNLKTVMNVQLIGDTTRGKDVGFFPVDLLEKISIYPVSFRTLNSQQQAVPHTGFVPNKLSPDGVQMDWGNQNDPCLANALSYISDGRYISSETNSTVSRSVTGNRLVKMKNIDKRVPGMYIEN